MEALGSGPGPWVLVLVPGSWSLARGVVVMVAQQTFLCFSTSRRLERRERSHGPAGSSTRTSSGSLRTSTLFSKMKEKKVKEEEEEKATESPSFSEEKLKDEEVSEVEGEESSIGKKLVTNGDAEGEEPQKAEMTDESEDVKQEVRNPPCTSSPW